MSTTTKETEQEKIEKLLQPRVKCVGNEKNHYPHSPFKVGCILYYHKSENMFSNGFYIGNPNNVPFYTSIAKTLVDNHPHLFQPLQWWEERSVEEMPQYIKVTDDVIKVVKWQFNVLGVLYCHIEWIEQGEKVINDNQCYKVGFPATEQEYLNYQNQTK